MLEMFCIHSSVATLQLLSFPRLELFHGGQHNIAPPTVGMWTRITAVANPNVYFSLEKKKAPENWGETTWDQSMICRLSRNILGFRYCAPLQQTTAKVKPCNNIIESCSCHVLSITCRHGGCVLPTFLPLLHKSVLFRKKNNITKLFSVRWVMATTTTTTWKLYKNVVPVQGAASGRNAFISALTCDIQQLCSLGHEKF